jgi:hypothetical protein
MGEDPAIGVGRDVEVWTGGFKLIQFLTDLCLALLLVQLLEDARDGGDLSVVNGKG